jgi:5-methylcytosine-specific restriction endonuclease McrA
MTDVTCPCGAPLEHPKRGRPRKFCTTCRPVRIDSRRQRYVQIGPKSPHNLHCVVCSERFTSKSARAKFCSSVCRWRSRYLPGGCYAKSPIKCAQCGQDTPRWAGSVEGKTRCQLCIKDGRRAGHGTRKMYRDFKCRCDECREFMNAAFREYARKYREANGKNLYDQYRAPGARKRDAARRRARLMDAFVEDVDPIRVFEADGYRCYGCDRKCIKGAPNNHPLQPTLDHVIPLSKGGTHEYTNIRTMCRQCNVRKGDRGGGEQLLLIG